MAVYLPKFKKIISSWLQAKIFTVQVLNLISAMARTIAPNPNVTGALLDDFEYTGGGEGANFSCYRNSQRLQKV